MKSYNWVLPFQSVMAPETRISSYRNPRNVWNPPQSEDIAKLTNMKKKRKEKRGETSICNTAAGYDMKASPIPPFTTYMKTFKQVKS